jgi:hypothetical protein
MSAFHVPSMLAAPVDAAAFELALAAFPLVAACLQPASASNDVAAKAAIAILFIREPP